MTPAEKTAEKLKGAVVFVAAGGSQKHMRAAADQAGAKVVDGLTPNVDILVGDDDNRLVQQAQDLNVAVWSEDDLMTATAGAPAPPPPPPPPDNDQDAVCKKTIYVRRYPALPGDVASDSGTAGPLVYSWLDGSSSADIEAGLRFLFGATADDVLRLLDSRGCDVPITSAIPNGCLFTLRLVPTTRSAPPSATLSPIICRPNVNVCTISFRSSRRWLPAPLRSAIDKRQRDNEQWAHKPTKKFASASLVPRFKLAEASPSKRATGVAGVEYYVPAHVQDAVVGAKADEANQPPPLKPEAKEPQREDGVENEQDLLDVATQWGLAAKKLASEAQALNKWAAEADDDVDTDCEHEGTIEQVVPASSEGATSPETTVPPGIAATAKAKVQKLVDGAKVVIKKVSAKVSERSVQTAPQSKSRTADAVRSAHKRISYWLPSRTGQSDVNAPLRPTTPV